MSFMNGRNGESHTTVGIFRFLHSARTFARPSVVQTAGSMTRQRFLSAVVSVIWTTAFDFALISSIYIDVAQNQVAFCVHGNSESAPFDYFKAAAHKAKLRLAVHVGVAHRACSNHALFALGGKLLLQKFWRIPLYLDVLKIVVHLVAAASRIAVNAAVRAAAVNVHSAPRRKNSFCF